MTESTPSTDFYDYCNREWLNSNSIPDDHASWNNFTALNKHNQEFLKSHLEAPTEAPAEATAEAPARRQRSEFEKYRGSSWRDSFPFFTSVHG